jgi:hypothetical protein
MNILKDTAELLSLATFLVLIALVAHALGSV